MLLIAMLCHLSSLLGISVARQLRSRQFVSFPSRSLAGQCRINATPLLRLHCNSSLSMLFRRVPAPCHSSVLHSVSFRLLAGLCNSMSDRCISSQCRLVSILGNSIPSHCVASLRRLRAFLCPSDLVTSAQRRIVSLPFDACRLRLIANLLISASLPFPAPQIRANAELCIAVSSHRNSLHRRLVAFQSVSFPVPLISAPVPASPFLFEAQPCGAGSKLINALQFRRAYAVNASPAGRLPSMTLPASSSSSHQAQPFPLFRHWPKPCSSA